MSRITSSRTVIAGAAVVLLSVTGCGDDGGPEPEAQPTPEGTSFEERGFDGIPLPPRAEPVGGRNEEDGIVVQSFSIRNRTPQDVMDFYVAQMSDDEVVTSPEQSGTATLLAEWRLDDGRTLLVTTLPAPTAPGEADGAEVVSQLSLTLRPAGDAHHEDESGSDRYP